MLAVQDATGSPSSAGTALGAFAIGAGVVAPARGRLVDAFGVRRALVPFALASGALLLALAAAAQSGAPAGVLVALAGAGGLTVPPLIASARMVWPDVVAPEDLPRAHGVQALLGDLGGVCGPALAGALAALASPAAGVAVCALLPAAGALVLAGLPWRRRERPPGRGGALRSAGLRTLVLGDATVYAGLGALEVALPALAAREGAAASAAIPLAVFAGTSALASLAWGARTGRPAARLPAGALALAVLTAPLAGAGSVWAAVPVLAAAGAAFAAINVAVYGLLDAVAPEGTGAEAMTWLTTAGATGSAIGAALAGRLAGAGHVHAALAVPCAGAALGAVALIARRGTL